MEARKGHEEARKSQQSQAEPEHGGPGGAGPLGRTRGAKKGRARGPKRGGPREPGFPLVAIPFLPPFLLVEASLVLEARGRIGRGWRDGLSFLRERCGAWTVEPQDFELFFHSNLLIRISF